MARKLNDKFLDSKEARRRLKPSRKPYWTFVEHGKVHLGYRRTENKSGISGTWIVRHYLGHQKYQQEQIGTADDHSDADGIVIFDFHQAIAAARVRMLPMMPLVRTCGC